MDGEALKNDLDSLIALLPETDVSSSQHQPVDSSSASSEWSNNYSNYDFKSSGTGGNLCSDETIVNSSWCLLYFFLFKVVYLTRMKLIEISFIRKNTITINILYI